MDTVFPIRCIGCGRLSSEHKRRYLCASCISSIKLRIKFECIGCKNNTDLGKTCYKCRSSNPTDQLLIVLDYGNPLVVKMVKCFKYRFIQEIINPLSAVMRKYIIKLSRERCFNISGDGPIIIPVPLHQRRLNWRGFNQAELIAQSLSNALQAKTEMNCLRRIRKSRPQAEIEEKAERLKKPRGQFELINTESIIGRTVILVDDVCTTGATLNECARLLKNIGVKEVIGFVIARG